MTNDYMTANEVLAMPPGMDKVRAFMSLPADEKKAADRLVFTPTERLMQATMNANFRRLTAIAEEHAEAMRLILVEAVRGGEQAPLLLHMAQLHAALMLRAELCGLSPQTLDKTFGEGSRFALFDAAILGDFKKHVAAEVFGHAN